MDFVIRMGTLPDQSALEGNEMAQNRGLDEPNPEKRIPTGGEKLIQCLEREGVEYIFGLSGGAAMPMFDALVDSSIQLVLTRHEQGATHMADGYARSTGRPGVVLVTSGPGATNTVTGLLTALMDSAPIIVICGQTISPMLGKDAFQEADVTGITYPVVKHSYLVKDGSQIPRIIREAFHVATTGRPGPVLIDVPKDIGQAPCPAPFTDAVDLPGYRVPARSASEPIAEAARLLRESRRPVLYVGNGAVISGADKAVTTLAEKLRAEMDGALMLDLFENRYSPGWWWLTAQSSRVSKGEGLRRLAEREGFDLADTMVFGDALNDIPMFDVAGWSVAVENALPEVKAAADEVIGPHTEDAVVEWMRKRVS